MLFQYMYHSRQRRTRIEEQQGSLFSGGHVLLVRCPLGGEEQQAGHTHARGAYGTALLSAKFIWCARNVLCVAHACGLADCVRGQFLLA